MSTTSGTAVSYTRSVVAALRKEFGADAVHRGRHPSPVGPFPFVSVAGRSERSTQGPPRYWTRRATLDVVAWEAAADLTQDERVEAAEELLDRARNAIEAAKADPADALYLAEDLEVTGAAVGWDLDLVPDGYTVAVLTVEFGYRERGT